MAISASAITASAQGLVALPVTRQLIGLAGLAASVALGFWVVLWSQQSSYEPLFNVMSNQDTGAVIESLKQAEIPYKLDEKSGLVLVESSQVQTARIKLAAQGMTGGTGLGFELMDKGSSFSESRFAEAVRYQRALEGELARSITSLLNVRSARVHLAIPRQSSFVGRGKRATASVVMDLYAGRKLSDEELAGVVHLVSASIPDMAAEDVSVIDQHGRLLTSAKEDGFGLSQKHLSYLDELEGRYTQRIQDILSPIVGIGRVKAQVVADVDFNYNERTSETFDPNNAQVRSESSKKDETVGSQLAYGIPGALSNQPPGAGTAPEQTQTDPATGTATETAAETLPKSTTEQAVRNYELDKTISHQKNLAGEIKRLSVGVVIDNPPPSAEGEPATGYSDEAIGRFTQLVRHAVGFNEARGDTVTVINTPFSRIEPVEPLPEPPLWEQPWVHDGARMLGAAVVVLVLILFVLRPAARALVTQQENNLQVLRGGEQAGEPYAEDGVSASLSGPVARLGGPDPSLGYENDLETVKQLANQDPQKVAQVMKNWIGEGG